MVYPDATATALPGSYDLRSVGANHTNYITDVRNQGGCNSCTAYAVVAAIEGAISIKQNVNNPTIHLSEDNLFLCGGNGDCHTDAWYPDEALTYCRDTGVVTAADYANDPQCTPIIWPVTKIASFKQLGGSGRDQAVPDRHWHAGFPRGDAVALPPKPARLEASERQPVL